MSRGNDGGKWRELPTPSTGKNQKTHWTSFLVLLLFLYIYLLLLSLKFWVCFFFFCNWVIIQHAQRILCCYQQPISVWLQVLLNGECSGWCKSCYDKLALLGCWSLALIRAPRLPLDELRAPFRPYQNWWSEGPQRQEYHQGREEWSFWASIKV